MKQIHSPLILIVLSIFLVSCGNDKKSDENNYTLNITGPSKKIRSGDEVQLSVETQNKTFDSIQYYYGEQFLGSNQGANPIKVQLKTPLGEHALQASLFKKGNSEKIEKKLILHAHTKPAIYTYKVIESYPHDPHAFTQGLEFLGDTLYEGTGQYGVSALRKVDLKTGKVLQETKLNRQYFGEGITILNDKVYQLTWREGKGFIYDAQSLKELSSFDYNQSKEGWGLCNDGQYIYKSDGSNKIWRLDPETLKEIDYIVPVTRNAVANRVNELEYINGKIYANTWQKDGVLIIDPKTGAVEGIIDFRGLKKKLGNQNKADVLNGIAYHQESNKLYVTGKNWDKLFEVEIIKK